MSEDHINLSELQQIMSASLDLIESLKRENAELQKALSFCMNCIKEDRESNLHAFRGIEQEYWKMYCRIAHLKNLEKLREAGINKEKCTHIPFEGKGVVYSVITGNYDRIKEVDIKAPDLDYIMFTDDPDLKSDTWEIRILEPESGLDSARLSRKPKILPHVFLSDYDYSIYIDANLKIRGNLREYVKRYRNTQPFLCCPHYSNDCIYEEAKTCLKLNKDTPERINSQVDQFRKEGYPVHNGLISGGFLVRDHNDPIVISLMNDWWNMVRNHSKRDQLSFDYVCWKHNFLYDTSDLMQYDNDYLTFNENHGGS